MIPSYYACSSCQQKYRYAFAEAWYYVGTLPAANRLADDDLLSVNVRPGWCKDCDCLCLVEDIASLLVFEGAYATVRAGGNIEYPVHTEYIDAPVALKEVEDQLRWRMARRRPARALCCGGSRYQLMDVAQPVFKHAECDFGVVKPGYFYIGGYMRPSSGMRVYDPEGDLIGLLGWCKEDERMWDIAPLHYPPSAVD